MARQPNANAAPRSFRAIISCFLNVSFAAFRHDGDTLPIHYGFRQGSIILAGGKLVTGSAPDDKRPRRDYGRAGSAIGILVTLAVMAPAAPAAAAYWYGGGWYGGWHKHRSAHKSRGTKASDRAEKDPFGQAAKGPQQIFISINQQKLHLYSNGVHVADTSIATGVADHPTPLGVFSVIQKQVFHRSNIYSNAPMPYMQRVTWSGVAMHEGQNIGHPASHGCIRMPHDFAVRLYRFTKLNTRVVIARGELRPVEFADPHLFVHKERPPEIAAPVANEIEPAVAQSTLAESTLAKPAELAVRAGGLTAPVQSDVVTPAGTAPAVTPAQKIESAAPPEAAAAAPGAAPPTPPATPADLAKVAAAKKMPIS